MKFERASNKCQVHNKWQGPLFFMSVRPEQSESHIATLDMDRLRQFSQEVVTQLYCSCL